jgi:hypothetical protein
MCRILLQLAKVYDKHKFRCQNIYDTAGITAQKPNRIATKKGLKQVGAVTSAEALWSP